jgi:mannose-6-phosphate isomerase-like protein (cupin superfamily)
MPHRAKRNKGRGLKPASLRKGDLHNYQIGDDMSYIVLNRDELPRDGNTHDFEGFQYDDTEVSFIWVDTPPGGAVRLYQHPYKEIFIIQDGVSTFTVGSETCEAYAGQVIIVPANTPHKFINFSDRRLKQVDIHINKKFITHWLED